MIKELIDILILTNVRLFTKNPKTKVFEGDTSYWFYRIRWLQGWGLNLRPSGYEPDELGIY